MAEIVQYHLEKMVGELEDLERRELFSKPELKAIVKKRTKFEYALKRRRVPRAAFLRYVEYEMNVDALRQRRKSRMGQVGQKTTLSDYSIRQRIISIYERAVVRHSDDIDMWLQFIDFVKSQRAGGSQDEDAQGFTRLLGQLYARAITAHPYEAQLWILAAAHEFEANVNGTAARVLLQRAIRVNPKDKRLWIEYFRLEILLVEKIKARRRVLGIDGAEEAVAAGAEDAAEGAVAAEDANVIRLGELDEERQAAGDELRLIEERLEASALAKMAGGRKPAALSAEQRSAMAQQANAYLQGA
ncbi:U3 snoRNP protein, partial [Kickxella alabastrina]